MAAVLLAAALACERAPERPRDARAPSSPGPTGTAVRVDLTGAGATFPYPLYARWFNSYALREGTRINYLAVGSGEGIRRVVSGAVDFGASDVPVAADTSLGGAAASRLLHLPMVLGAVAITYNLPPRARPLQLSASVLADIFLGRITRWDDRRIAALNAEAPLPALPIRVVHRDDGSGTTYIFTDYLAAVSAPWARTVGRGRTVRWPAGAGSNGNEGVAGTVKQTPGAIGYVEVVYARQNRLPSARLENRAGRFVSPMPFEIARAATARVEALRGAPWMEASLVDAPGRASYPLVSFTWLLVDPAALGAAKAAQFRDFVQWALTEGADVASTLGYVPLPTLLADAVQARLGRAVAADSARLATPGIPRDSGTP